MRVGVGMSDGAVLLSVTTRSSSTPARNAESQAWPWPAELASGILKGSLRDSRMHGSLRSTGLEDAGGLDFSGGSLRPLL